MQVAGPSRTHIMFPSSEKAGKKKKKKKTFPATGRAVRGAGVSSGVCAGAHACAERPGDGRGVKKGPAFERQRRKMAATTGSGELGRRARLAKGARAWAGDRGPAKVLRRDQGLCVTSVRLAPRWRAGRPEGGGGAGGGRKHGRGPEGPVGGAAGPTGSPGRREGPAERKDRPQGAAERPELARGEPRGIPEETEAGGSAGTRRSPRG